MPALWISYCTDHLLLEHAPRLLGLLGDFEAYTHFGAATTLVVFGESPLPLEPRLERLRTLLAPCGLMRVEPARCRAVTDDVAARRSFVPPRRVRSASPRTHRRPRHRTPAGSPAPASSASAAPSA